MGVFIGGEGVDEILHYNPQLQQEIIPPRHNSLSIKVNELGRSVYMIFLLFGMTGNKGNGITSR
jgi:hypothetical protein